MNKFRTIIAVSAPQVRRQLVEWLELDDELQLTGEATTAGEATKLVEAGGVDLVWVAVDLPEKGVFNWLAGLRAAQLPPLIFVAQEESSAVAAFEVGAVDYVLPPLSAERVAAAVRRAKAELVRRRAESLQEQVAELVERLDGPVASAPAAARPADAVAAGPLERLVFKTGGEIHFLKVADIDWVEAEGDYVRFHAGGRTHLLRETMAHLEARLDPQRFVRIHRSTIVNLDRVRKLSPSFAGEYAVLLHDGTKLRLSRGYQERLQTLWSEPL
jgi:two-component system LytT family response regulator